MICKKNDNNNEMVRKKVNIKLDRNKDRNKDEEVKIKK